ncbi:MAG: hypothetical protein IH971_11085, partial [Candidatus Marinimicrobia bacterium]|nr:hypothetical protein [Candidatus Neomarinimicrobiota bacterium]
MKYLRKSECLLFACSVIVFSSPVKVDAQDQHRIAVLDIQGQGISRPEAETLTNYMRIEVAATGAVASVKQSEISAVLSDMGMEEAGCTSPDCALEVGRLLAASHVIIGSVMKSEQGYDLDFQLFNIETRSVQSVVAHTYRGDLDGLIMSLEKIAWDFMDLSPAPEGLQDEKQAPDPVLVTFTSGDWNIPKTITFYGVNDDIDDGDQTYAIIAGPVVSDDTIYANIEPTDVAVTNTNDDVAGITVDPIGGLQTSEAGGGDTFTVVLTSEPTANVSIALSSSDTTEGTVSPSLLVFNAGNWNIL